MKINFFVEGTPKPQPRPRACKRGNHAMMYDCGTADGWKWQVGKTAKEYAPQQVLTGELMLYINLFLKRPNSHFYSSKKRFGELREDAPVYHKTKPDTDNFAKAIMDAISDSQCIWKDDGQVSVLYISKMYADVNEKVGADISISTLEAKRV